MKQDKTYTVEDLNKLAQTFSTRTDFVCHFANLLNVENSETFDDAVGWYWYDLSTSGIKQQRVTDAQWGTSDEYGTCISGDGVHVGKVKEEYNSMMICCAKCFCTDMKVCMCGDYYAVEFICSQCGHVYLFVHG
jgi:hypothetical protein